MSNIKHIEEFIDLAKSSTPKVIQLCREFSEEFPHASFTDYKKAFKAFVNGYDLSSVIARYVKAQAEEGKVLAKKDLQSILKMDDCIDEMVYDLLHGKERGTSTYINKLDDAWTWRLGEFNIWTGYTNEGKSLFLRFISLVKAIKDKWRFAFYAPEDYPAKEFFDDLIHTGCGKTTDPLMPGGAVKEVTYRKVANQIKDYFYFVYIKPPENTLDNIIREFDQLIDSEGIKGCIIDPIIKLSRPREFMQADDKYAAYVTTLCTDFARTKNISLNLVMHQLTPRLQENGLYPKPTYYNIKGGGTWVDGTDNVLSVQRPLYARDKIDDEVIFTSQKIKKQKLVGIPQEIKFRFERKRNRYLNYETKDDAFDFSEGLGTSQMSLLKHLV
jgi:twinkle protein